ncbi:glycoside hydrolase superfamily [Chytriomyces cf. hyalinus JEL632]|nr:glycoside hydrolase superfamily [Chytriomyces cf. hyalinus JEL632]
MKDQGLKPAAPPAKWILLSGSDAESDQDTARECVHSQRGASIDPDNSLPRAHEWSKSAISTPNSVTDPSTLASHFKDEHGRVVHLRGVNVCGHSKLPTYPHSGSTHVDTPEFFNHRNVSFIGRPFALSEADEHFQRIKSWGLTFVRLLVTWESLEHAGPGIYDEEFITYLVQILKKAENHGVKCFIDPHQDTWSRFSGGSGAPGWTFEICGMDLTSFQTVNAAHVHNLSEKVAEPHMFWPTNYSKLASATMFTLFFAGHVLAPDAKYQGVNVGTFMQERYVACYAHLAERLRHCKAVVGFEFMNEPHYGYIGLKSMLQFDPYVFLHYGLVPNALQSFALGSGMEVDVDHYVKNFVGLTNKSGTKRVNSEKRSAWLKYGECVWKQHGVWGLDAAGNPVVLKPDYFTKNPATGAPIDFYKHFYVPLIRRYAQAIQAVNAENLIFFGPIPNEDPPVLNSEDRVHPNLVYAPHWYDLKALNSKGFDPSYTLDVQGLARGTKNLLSAIYFGASGAEKNYTGQLGNIVRAGRTMVGSRPIVLGEVGIPMDINNKEAYESGDYETHNLFLDTVISSMEANMLNFTLWNYNPGNDNTHGDHWNGEDFRAMPDVTALEGDPNHFLHVGGRALDAVVRPYAAKIAGVPRLNRFNLENLVYVLEFTSVYNPVLPSMEQLVSAKTEAQMPFITELFVPNFHYKFHNMNLVVDVSDGDWKYDEEKQSLYWMHDPLFTNSANAVPGDTVVHKLTLRTPLSKGGYERHSKGIFLRIWEFLTEVCE